MGKKKDKDKKSKDKKSKDKTKSEKNKKVESNSAEETFNAIKTLYKEFKTQAKLRIKKSDKKAGVASRKATMELQTLLKQWRKDSL